MAQSGIKENEIIALQAALQAQARKQAAPASPAAQATKSPSSYEQIRNRHAQRGYGYGYGQNSYSDFFRANPMMALILQSMLDNQTAQNEAKQANESRYQDILQGSNDILGSNQARYADLLSGSDKRYGDLANDSDARRQRILNTLVGSGQQEATDIKQNWANQQAGAEQNLVSRGMANTTLRNDAGRAATKGMSNDLGRLQDRLRNTVAGYDASLSGDTLGIQGQGVQSALGIGNQAIGDMTNLGQSKLGFMERRTDEYPAGNDLMTLLGQYFPDLMNAGSANGGGNMTQQNVSNMASNPLMTLMRSYTGGGNMNTGPYGRSSAAGGTNTAPKPGGEYLPGQRPVTNPSWGADSPQIAPGNGHIGVPVVPKPNAATLGIQEGMRMNRNGQDWVYKNGKWTQIMPQATWR